MARHGENIYVSFANREGGFYYARVVNQIPFEGP